MALLLNGIGITEDGLDMKHDFWHERWLRNEIGFHQQGFNTHLQEFWRSLGLPADAGVFVPLCGKTLDLLWLRAQGHEVMGVEISPVAVRDFFRENDLTPRVSRQGLFERWETDGLAILCGDFFDLGAGDLKNCSGVFDRASLIALPPEMRRDYAIHLRQITPPMARTLLVAMEYPQEQMQGPPFSVREEEVRELYDQAYDITRLYSLDILEENVRFQEKGLTSLIEKVYRLEPGG
jgi:thiopurine S-methyltransferase